MLTAVLLVVALAIVYLALLGALLAAVYLSVLSVLRLTHKRRNHR